jgi:hypothetical protein
MVKRHYQGDATFYCYTDNTEGLDADVVAVPFPDIANIAPQYWFGKEEYALGLARCWDRPKTFVFNSHHWLNTSGRFMFLDLDVIIQNDITPLVTYNFARPTMLRSWWENPANVANRGFVVSHGTILNGSCQVWSDDQCECIWNDVLQFQDRIWFTYTGGTDNYHYWRWRELWDTFPSTFAYCYNRGREFPIDATIGKYRPACILCIFNVDVVAATLSDRTKLKQDELVDPELLAHWQ